MGWGRKGDRLAMTPIRVFPPRRGGRTVGDQCGRMAWEKDQISHRWVNPSKPRRASGFRYSGSNTTVASRSSTRPLCRGIPNYLGKAPCRVAMIFMGMELCITHLQSLKNGKDSSLSILIGPARCKKIVQKEEKTTPAACSQKKPCYNREKKEIAWPPRDLGPKAKEKE